MNDKTKLGLIIAIIGAIFSIAETIYFGSNFLPQSDAEILCDLIGISITVGGISLFNCNYRR